MNKPFAFFLVGCLVVLMMWIMFIFMSAKSDRIMQEKERVVEIRERR